MSPKPTSRAPKPATHADGDAVEALYLDQVGKRLRHQRAQRGTTRRILAERSGVSERHIAQVESGIGNISILLLRRLADALGIDIAELVSEKPERRIDQVLLEQSLSRLNADQLNDARQVLLKHFGLPDGADGKRRIALVGLRGAGKSTLGRRLAELRQARFVELDREIEREGRMELRELFEIHGQQGFHRLEYQALQRVVGGTEAMVIETGGSLVTEAATYELLLSHCLTVWVKASPEEHMRRVMAQGDLRPMRDGRGAMQDLHAILKSRETLYAQAELTLDTSGKSPEASVAELSQLIDSFGG